MTDDASEIFAKALAAHKAGTCGDLGCPWCHGFSPNVDDFVPDDDEETEMDVTDDCPLFDAEPDDEAESLLEAGWRKVVQRGGGEMWRSPVTQHQHTRAEALAMLRAKED